MTLLSLFMTSTGIFCFVPISQRLIESGIIPESNRWQFRRLPSVLPPTFYSRKEHGPRSLLSTDDAESAWLETEECHQTKHPLCSADDTFITDKRLAMPCPSEQNTVIVSPGECSPLQSISIDTFYESESASCTSDSILCDGCNTLLRREIPPDHIPSVVRAFALLEAQDRFSDVVFNEYEVASLINAFSMLRL